MYYGSYRVGGVAISGTRLDLYVLIRALDDGLFLTLINSGTGGIVGLEGGLYRGIDEPLLRDLTRGYIIYVIGYLSYGFGDIIGIRTFIRGGSCGLKGA